MAKTKKKAYKKIVKSILDDLKKQADTKAIKEQIAHRSFDSFFSISSKYPLCEDPYIQELWFTYGIPSVIDSDNPYLWYEMAPVISKDAYLDSFKSLSKKKQKKIEKFAQRYNKTENHLLAEYNQNDTIDYIKLYNWHQKPYPSYDFRETYDFSLSFAFLLYPRIKFIEEFRLFNNQETKKGYYKKAIKPVLKSLIYEMYLDYTTVYEWMRTHTAEYDDKVISFNDIYSYIEDEIVKGYVALAYYHRSYVV